MVKKKPLPKATITKGKQKKANPNLGNTFGIKAKGKKR